MKNMWEQIFQEKEKNRRVSEWGEKKEIILLHYSLKKNFILLLIIINPKFFRKQDSASFSRFPLDANF